MVVHTTYMHYKGELEFHFFNRQSLTHNHVTEKFAIQTAEETRGCSAPFYDSPSPYLYFKVAITFANELLLALPEIFNGCPAHSFF